MSRPVNADADATKRRILESAVGLFAERGMGSTSVRDVAGAAGVSLAMVSHYFGGKDALYEACVEAMYAELAAMSGALSRELASEAPLAELFARAVVTSYRFAREHRRAVRLLLQAAASSGELHPRGKALLFGALDVVSAAVGARLERPPHELRLPLQSVVFLVARYAAQGEGELAVVVGVAPRERHRAQAAVEEHLVEVAVDAFGLRAKKTKQEKKQEKRGAR